MGKTSGRKKKQTLRRKVEEGGRLIGARCSGQCAVCEGVNDEKLCRPRLVRSPGYETARQIDGQTDGKNEWPFSSRSGDGPDGLLLHLSLSLFFTLLLFSFLSRPCSP